MKPEDGNNDDDAFERELARFRREPPPADWRDELIANASSEKGRGIPTISPATRKLVAGLAAAWAVTAALWIATPVDDTDYTGRNRSKNRERIPLEPAWRPMLAWRTGYPADIETLP